MPVQEAAKIYKEHKEQYRQTFISFVELYQRCKDNPYRGQDKFIDAESAKLANINKHFSELQFSLKNQFKTIEAQKELGKEARLTHKTLAIKETNDELKKLKRSLHNIGSSLNEMTQEIDDIKTQEEIENKRTLTLHTSLLAKVNLESKYPVEALPALQEYLKALKHYKKLLSENKGVKNVKQLTKATINLFKITAKKQQQPSLISEYQAKINTHQTRYHYLLELSDPINKNRLAIDAVTQPIAQQNQEINALFYYLKSKLNHTKANLAPYCNHPQILELINENQTLKTNIQRSFQSLREKRENLFTKPIAENWPQIYSGLNEAFICYLKEKKQIANENSKVIEDFIHMIDNLIAEKKEILKETLTVTIHAFTDKLAELEEYKLESIRCGLESKAIASVNLSLKELTNNIKSVKDLLTFINDDANNEKIYNKTGEIINQIETNQQHFEQQYIEIKHYIGQEIKKAKQKLNHKVEIQIRQLNRLSDIKQQKLPFKDFDEFYIDSEKEKRLFTIDGNQLERLNHLLFPHIDESLFNGSMHDLECRLYNEHQIIDELNKTKSLINETIKQRIYSQENQTIKAIIVEINRQIPLYEIRAYDPRRELLQELKETFVNLQNNYLSLQIKDKRQFIEASIHRVEEKLIENNLEDLSNEERYAFIQLIRKYLLCKLTKLLNHILVWRENTPYQTTFFAGANEKRMAEVGFNALAKLHTLRENGSIHKTV